MSQQIIKTQQHASKNNNDTGAILVGTGLAVASMILVPAVAMRLGLGASLTGALRIALMRASSYATHSGKDDSAAGVANYSCH